MKRRKKLLTGLLTLAMTLSMMTMTAFAAEGGSTATTTKMPTIDTRKDVSLTIHKYEYNGNLKPDGTGSATDVNNVPAGENGAKPLSGVQFTIWKVADLADYYGEDGAVLPKVEDFELTGKGDAAELKKKGSTTPFSGKISKETVNGVITFDGPKVTQGLYYVSETNAPANVTGKTDDFLVSLPMTNVEGNDWIYDVHVFPKNKTTYGGVTLVKQGKEGTKAAVSLEGAEFILQMKDKEATTAKWDYLKYDDSSTSAKWTYTGVAPTDATKFKTDSNGQINVKDLTAGTYRFIEVSAPNGYIMDGTKKYQFTIDTDGKVTWEEDANVGGIGTTSNVGGTHSAIVTITNEKPDTEKFVMDRKSKDWEADADYRVGAVVPYLIRVDVPSNVAKLKTFKLTDTMKNLTYKDGSFKIYNTKATDYTGTAPILTGITPTVSGKTWEIEFNTVGTDGTITSSVEAYKGQSIYIYFEATLDNNAAMTEAGNPNNITLDYSNAIYPTGDPSNPNDGKDPIVDYIKDVVNVFTFGIDVLKLDGEATTPNTPLDGVTFDLYRVKDGVSLPAAPAKVTEAWLKTAGNAVKIGSKTTGADGKLSFEGLDNATYYLVETQTKAGYNLLKEPYKAVLNLTATFTKETTKKITTDSVNETVTTETTTTTIYGTGAGVGTTNGKFVVTVKNYKGFTLPTTGGIGTFVFTFAGIAMMAAAVILLITSKKKKAE